MSVFLILLALIIPLFAEQVKFGNLYNFDETFLLYDGGTNNVGYQVKGKLNLEILNHNVISVTLESPKLLISSKRQNHYEFIPHTSNIDHYNNDPFLIEISDGLIKKIYASKDEDKGMLNIKKSIANVFQFQTADIVREETDLSGLCRVGYSVINTGYIVKSKYECTSDSLKTSVWGIGINSSRKSYIHLENQKLATVISWEEHLFRQHVNEYVKSNVTSKIVIESIGTEILEAKYPSQSIKNIIAKVESDAGKVYESHDLIPENTETFCPNCPKFGKVITERGKYLDVKYIGTAKSASVFLQAIKAARMSTAEDIYTTINSKRNKKIIPQLMDILGAAQTVSTHQAALKLLKITTDKYELDLCERYLWALSTAPASQLFVVKDLKEIAKGEISDNKLKQSILSTLASMVKKLEKQPKLDNPEKIAVEIVDFFLKKMKECKDDECKRIYIKALSNLPHIKALPDLLELAENSKNKPGAKALKVISKLDPKFWDKRVINVAERVLLSNETYDSSARLFALDILLESKGSFAQLSRIMSILKLADKSRELKEYLLQRIEEISQKNSTFREEVKRVFRNGYNNYNIQAQGGLSTVLSRSFMAGGTLSSTQEIFGGVLKQGNVKVNLMHNEDQIHTPFTLGIFAGGLSSFVSSSEEEEEETENNEKDDEVATAGLELTVLGVELRPFVFFNGTGELMGHVWSGTGSTLTPAFQAVLLLEETNFTLPLMIAETLDIQVRSAASVELAGQIEISLWNRNAHSLVKNRAGILLSNIVTLNSPFVETDINFELTTEPELHLISDLDFSDGSSLCLQLQQPSMFVKFNSYKTETIPGTSQISRKNRKVMLSIFGKTYSLNAKNSQMCNKVFQ